MDPLASRHFTHLNNKTPNIGSLMCRNTLKNKNKIKSSKLVNSVLLSMIDVGQLGVKLMSSNQYKKGVQPI